MREYGIDLMERITDMSWRRFVNLARNLSPFGAVALRAQQMREAPTTDDADQAAVFFAEMQAGR